MVKRRSAWLTGLTVAAVTGVAACNAPATPSSDLNRDLDAASSTSSSLTLAPTSGRQDIVSAVERVPEARRTPAPSQQQVVAHNAPPPVVTAPQIAAPPQAVAVAPAIVTPPPSAASPSPRPTPVQQAPRGGYKTEAEVVRNAPFPIQP